MSNEVLIATLGLLGTLATTFGVIWLKRHFELEDTTRAREEAEERRVERIDQTLPQVFYHLRHREQQIRSLSALCQFKKEGETRADFEARMGYICNRLHEMANETCPIDAWQLAVAPVVCPPISRRDA